MRVVSQKGIAYVLLPAYRGETRLTPDLHAAVAAAAAEIDLDESVRVVVVRSAGRAFCVGMPGRTDSGPLRRAGADAVAAIASLRVPVLALLHGDAIDEGLELAMACDLRIAVPRARLGLTQVARGELPAHGGTQRLLRLVGSARALWMLLLGEPLSGADAERAGLLHAVVPPSRIEATGRRLSAALASRAPIAQRFAKEALRAAHDLPLAEGLRLEGDLYVLLQGTADRDEGIASFHEKRVPTFTGR